MRWYDNPHPDLWADMAQAADVLGVHRDAVANALIRTGVDVFMHQGKRFVLLADLTAVTASYPKQTWSKEEIARFRNLWGYRPLAEIARLLGRTETALEVKAKKLKLPAVADWPGVYTEVTLSPLLGMDRKSVWRLMRIGAELPAITLYKRNKPVQVVYEDHLCRWLKRPENWVFITDVDRISHPPFVAAIQATQRQWNDAWLTPGETAVLLGICHREVNKYIHRGSLQAVKHGNWRIQQSSAVALRDKLNLHRQFASKGGNHDRYVVAQ